jgi:tetratricopeptide (TPR) repeat protein
MAEAAAHPLRLPQSSVLVSEHLRDYLQRTADMFTNDQEILLHVAEIHVALSNFDMAALVLDQAVMLGPSPQALLQRSRVLFQLGRKEDAVNDLLAVVCLDTVEEDFVVEALRDLHRIDPARLIRDLNPELLSAMSPVAKAQVAGLLATPEDAFARAVPLLTDAVAGVEKDRPTGWFIRQQLSIFLLYRREWAKVLELWQDQAKFFTRRYHAMSLFHQALAWWGITGCMPELTCRQIVELAHSPSACDSHAPDCQALALVYWRLGEPARANEYVQKALRQIAPRVTRELSYWRCLEVTPEEFREDCQQIARLVEGDRVLPLVITEDRKP